MAQAPGHKFGQIIGDLLEEMIRLPLQNISDRNGLYLDFKHPRPARNGRRKVTWTDYKNNCHDLDYVIEDGGSENHIGVPKAFIECAWRRYTKHSRNKAQEIQGAISVLSETYVKYHPFLGIVLAGIFTEGSIRQLKSHGFSVVYCSYQTILEAFKSVGIDAHFDEHSEDQELQTKVNKYNRLSRRKKVQLVENLRDLVKNDLDSFLEELCRCLTRKVSRVTVIILHGETNEWNDINDAIQCILQHDENKNIDKFIRYELQVQYSNNDCVTARFEDKSTAIAFLGSLC